MNKGTIVPLSVRDTRMQENQEQSEFSLSSLFSVYYVAVGPGLRKKVLFSHKSDAFTTLPVPVVPNVAVRWLRERPPATASSLRRRGSGGVGSHCSSINVLVGKLLS